MFDPLLLVADEAVSALDVSIQAQILQLLTEIQRDTDVAMMFITHDLRVASQICDEIAVMYEGRMVELGRRYRCSAIRRTTTLSGSWRPFPALTGRAPPEPGRFEPLIK